MDDLDAEQYARLQAVALTDRMYLTGTVEEQLAARLDVADKITAYILDGTR